MNRIPRDRLRAAGSSSVANRSTTADCLVEEERPPTPPELGKFRRSYFKPGERTIHRGQVDDLRRIIAEREKQPASLQAFGSLQKESEHVQDLFIQGQYNEVQKIKNAHGEAHYRLTNVPIGVPRPSKTDVPERVKAEGFVFGNKAASSEPAKNLLFPEDPGEDLHPEVYIKSHGSLQPGAQTKHNYDWSKTGIDPHTHYFGKSDKIHGESAADCITQKKRTTMRVISKSQKDYMTAKFKYIGRPISYGIHTDKDRTFGLKSDPNSKPGDWGAGDCIRGDYGNDDDPKLGRCTRKGLRNVTTTTKAFGRPTIRDEGPRPKNISIADNQNYGADASASELLFPSQYASIGVHDEDFCKQRPPSTIRKIFANIGKVYTDDEFMRIWWRAATAGDINGDGIVSVTEFKNASNEYDSAVGSNTKPNWWSEAGDKGPAQLASDVADSQK